MERMERLGQWATDAQRLGFQRDLKAKLDALGVGPGEEFFLSRLAREPRARRGDPATSKAAAASVGDLRGSQQAVLRVMKQIGEPVTDERLVSFYQKAAQGGIVPAQSPSGVRSRRAELADAGLVIDTGTKERISTGREAKRWAVEDDNGSNGDAQRLMSVPQQSLTGSSAAFDPYD